jgi:c-di-GMP-binding flagellar brake protein YcgR
VQIALGLIGIVLVLFLVYILSVVFSKDIEFFSVGLDSGFKISEIFLLRKLSRTSKLEHPASLFWSVSALTRSIKRAVEDAKKSSRHAGDDFQLFLEKLYAYRTKIEIDNSNKKTIISTKNLGKGQRLRILLPGEGAFASQLIANNRDLVIALPMRQGRQITTGVRWKDKTVSVFLWRKNDASYTFDTTVVNEGFYSEFPVLYLQHTEQVFRTQKRKSVRAASTIYGDMFIISGIQETGGRETKPESLKCFLEDISADGALIRVGGKALKGLQLMLKFSLAKREIIMEGIVRGVEYNEDVNQSRMHFECEKIDTESKNVILSYVYDVLPQAEREIAEAIELAKQDEMTQADSEEASDESGQTDESPVPDESEQFSPS